MKKSKIIELIKILNPDTSDLRASNYELLKAAVSVHNLGFEQFRERLLAEIEKIEHPDPIEYNPALDMIERLLGTTELNLDDMEEDTRDTIEAALKFLDEHGRKQEEGIDSIPAQNFDILLPHGITLAMTRNAEGKLGGTVESSGLKQEIGKRYADALESLILAHACAGVDVNSPEYREGLETALEAIANNG